MRNYFKINLQLFAVQTTGLNSSGNSLSPEMKTYYDMNLLDNAEPELVHDQFGQKRPIPKGKGKTIEFRKFSALPKAMTPITEGVTPDGNKLNVTTVTATVQQYGDYITQSDVLELTAIDNTIVEGTKLLGSQAGRTLDTVTRNELVAGTNVMYPSKFVKNQTSGVIEETAVTARTGLDGSAKLTTDIVFKAVNQLKRMNVKPIDGRNYVCIIHPDVELDIMLSDAWKDIQKYANPENIYNGEIGMIGNCRFVSSSEAKIWKGGDTEPAGLAVYACLFIGEGAYGITEVEGGGLETIVKQKGSAGTADPLDQRSSVGWKALKTAKRLAEEAMVRVECCSSLSATATAN